MYNFEESHKIIATENPFVATLFHLCCNTGTLFRDKECISLFEVTGKYVLHISLCHDIMSSEMNELGRDMIDKCRDQIGSKLWSDKKMFVATYFSMSQHISLCCDMNAIENQIFMSWHSCSVATKDWPRF